MAGTAQMPRDVAPKSVLSAPAFKPAPKPTQAQMQAMRHVPKYLTKTRQVPVEPKQIIAPVSLDQTVRLDKYGIPTGQVGFAPPSNALSHKPTFRTETYQVPNPAYTEITVPYKAPAGPTPAQIEAARLEELRRIQAAYEAQKRAEMEAQKKQVKYLSNTTAEHRAALESGKSTYSPSPGSYMPTRTISGKVRNSYGDSGSTGHGGSLVG